MNHNGPITFQKVIRMPFTSACIYDTSYAATNKILDQYTIEVPKRVLGHKILGWTVWHGREHRDTLFSSVNAGYRSGLFPHIEGSVKKKHMFLRVTDDDVCIFNL